MESHADCHSERSDRKEGRSGTRGRFRTNEKMRMSISAAARRDFSSPFAALTSFEMTAVQFRLPLSVREAIAQYAAAN